MTSSVSEVLPGLLVGGAWEVQRDGGQHLNQTRHVTHLLNVSALATSRIQRPAFGLVSLEVPLPGSARFALGDGGGPGGLTGAGPAGLGLGLGSASSSPGMQRQGSAAAPPRSAEAAMAEASEIIARVLDRSDDSGAGGAIYVFSGSGHNRAIVAVIHYLVTRRHMHLRDAYTLVRQARSRAQPGTDFWRHLVAAERATFPEDRVSTFPLEEYTTLYWSFTDEELEREEAQRAAEMLAAEAAARAELLAEATAEQGSLAGAATASEGADKGQEGSDDKGSSTAAEPAAAAPAAGLLQAALAPFLPLGRAGWAAASATLGLQIGARTESGEDDDGEVPSPAATRWFFRYPLVGGVVLLLWLEFLAYVLLRVLVAACEWVLLPKKRRTRRVAQSASYSEWKDKAWELDNAEGKAAWREQDATDLYDYRLIKGHMEELRKLREQGNFKRLGHYLQNILHRNIGGINSEKLYCQTHIGTKNLVRAFYHEVCTCITAFAKCEGIPTDQRVASLQLWERSYGKTALCLSGGGGLGYFHLGVARALLEQDLLPSIVSGSSAGSLMACILAVTPKKELPELLTPTASRLFSAADEPWRVRLQRLWQSGMLFDPANLRRKLRALIGDMTFQEAFERTGIAYSVATTPVHDKAPPKILNYVSAPHVVIYSAVVASSAMPFLLGASPLLIKNKDGTVTEYQAEGLRWSDGSLKSDVPFSALSTLFSATSFIVSQVNPHVLPFFYGSTGRAGQPLRRRRAHRLRGGFLASAVESYLRLDMLKWLRLLSDLEAVPRVGRLDVASLYLQNFGGTVTITPRISLFAATRLLADPSEADMAEFLAQGERATWPTLSFIKATMRIERCIEQNMADIHAKDRALLPSAARQNSSLDLAPFGVDAGRPV